MATKELIRLMERFLVTRGHANYVQVCEKEKENEIFMGDVTRTDSLVRSWE